MNELPFFWDAFFGKLLPEFVTLSHLHNNPQTEGLSLLKWLCSKIFGIVYSTFPCLKTAKFFLLQIFDEFFLVFRCFVGGNDIIQACITGVEDTGEACIPSVNDNSETMPNRPEK